MTRVACDDGDPFEVDLPPELIKRLLEGAEAAQKAGETTITIDPDAPDPSTVKPPNPRQVPETTTETVEQLNPDITVDVPNPPEQS